MIKRSWTWHENFEKAWPQFKAQLGERFYRMWRYYLLSCAGAFRARDIQLWQWVLSKKWNTRHLSKSELIDSLVL